MTKKICINLLDLVFLIKCMKHPIKFCGKAELVGVNKLLAEIPDRIFISLVDSQRFSQEHYIVDRLQFGHITGQHQRE